MQDPEHQIEQLPPVSKATAKKRKMRADPEFNREPFQTGMIGPDEIQGRSWRKMLCVGACKGELPKRQLRGLRESLIRRSVIY